MSDRIELTVDADGIRVDRFLAERTQLSRSAIQRLARDGHVTANGAAVDPSHKVRAGESLVVDVPPPEEALSLEAEDIPIDVLYEDPDVIVVNKPAGLVVHPAYGHHSGTLVNAVAGRVGAATGREAGRPGIVHRLDKDTSGLLVVARTDEAHRSLAAQVAAREVERVYLALARGRLESRTGTIDAPIGRERRTRIRMAVSGAGAREARTHFEVLELLAGDSYVEVTLETGRTHQIRAHFAAIGHPLVGDPTYGAGEAYRLTRQFLHAHRLAFCHPESGQKLEFRSELPSDLESALELARRG